MKVKLLIEGMSCDHCVKHVEEALNEIEGLKNVDVILSSKSGYFETDGEIAEATIAEAIEEVGYELVGYEIV